MSAVVPPAVLPQRFDGPTCRACGCTDAYACIVEVRGFNRGCRWVEPDLCSACTGDEQLRARGPASGLSPLVLGTHGAPEA